MFTLTGKYNTATIFADADRESISQVIEMLNQPFAEGQTIRMMPDIHAGAGCTIGTTMTVTDKLCPNLVGVDIGCGMLAIRLKQTEINFERLDTIIRNNIPHGCKIRQEIHEEETGVPFEHIRCKNECDIARAKLSIGTLGGGNHFIEVDKDSLGSLWLVIHSGSRSLGADIATYYQKEAVLQTRQNPVYDSVPDDLCWCEGKLFQDYRNDMWIAQKYADINRAVIGGIILEKMGIAGNDSFSTIHNYLDTTRMILRKGAVSACGCERVLIPMNMRDGSLICMGLGNPEWNYSAPHGAGRLLSRSEAKDTISMEEYEESMKGIWTTSVKPATLDESPMAYKPMESITSAIKDTVRILDIIKPVYSFKPGN